MTKSEVKYIIQTVLGEIVDKTTPLMSVRYVTLDKFETKFQSVDSTRFKFNMTDETVEIYKCKKYDGDIPSNWVSGKHYDQYNGITYKYLFDESTLEPYVDVYDFSSVLIISPKNV